MFNKKNLFLLALSLLAFNLLDAQSLTGIESVEYDEVNNRFLISNGGSIIARAPDGTLSFFGFGIGADFGMEILGSTLFAIKGDGIKGYDLITETEVMSLSIPSASFLNGLANDGVSKLYATDFSDDKIYEIDVSDFSNPTATVIVNNTGSTPNGIVYDGTNNRLIFVSWGSNAPIKAVDLSTYEVSTLVTTSVGNIDGIDEDAAGNYYISSWTPARITKYNADFTSTPETITAPGLNSPADIGYAQAIDTLAVPNGNNTVTYIGFEPVNPGDTLDTAIHDLDKNPALQLSVYPNPSTINNKTTVISYELASPQKVKLALYNANGQLVKCLIDEQQLSGKHTVLLTGIELQQGMYICRLETNTVSVSEQITIIDKQ